MRASVKKIFDEVNKAPDIDGVYFALQAANNLGPDEKAEFLDNLSGSFSESAANIIMIEPLDRDDLSQGYRILYSTPKSPSS